VWAALASLLRGIMDSLLHFRPPRKEVQEAKRDPERADAAGDAVDRVRRRRGLLQRRAKNGKHKP
jgi:hypothetical protein